MADKKILKFEKLAGKKAPVKKELKLLDGKNSVSWKKK